MESKKSQEIIVIISKFSPFFDIRYKGLLMYYKSTFELLKHKSDCWAVVVAKLARVVAPKTRDPRFESRPSANFVLFQLF